MTNPSVANFGLGQDLLADENKEQILEWLADPSYGSVELTEALFSLVPEGEELAVEMVWNSDIVDFLRTADEVGETNPCNPSYKGYKIGKVDKICEILIQNDLTDVLERATYPVLLCQSKQDKLVTFENLPNVDSNPFLVLQEKPGDHSTSTTLCAFDALFFIASPEASTYVPDPKHIEGGCPMHTHAPISKPTTTSPTTKAPKNKAKAAKKRQRHQRRSRQRQQRKTRQRHQRRARQRYGTSLYFWGLQIVDPARKV